jgi:Ni/Co efflux regulator RcnB
MKLTDIRARAATGLILATLMAGPVFAEKPEWAGGGKPERAQGGKAERGGPQDKEDKRVDKRDGAGGREQRDDDGRGREGDRDQARERDREHRAERSTNSPRVSAHFTERHREIVHAYYGERFRVGDCPPGLAKKRNGCMPPGQAKKWRIGQTLPRDVVWYDAPGDIVLRLGMPPEGHRYVRVAADILLIAVGTGLVIDAIEDLNRL